VRSSATDAKASLSTDTRKRLVESNPKGRPLPLVESAASERPVPRIALSRQEAADSLGMSVDSFERYVQPHVKLVRRGSMRIVPVTELERWIAENAEWTLSESRDAVRISESYKWRGRCL
jgi:hypothetical protein